MSVRVSYSIMLFKPPRSLLTFYLTTQSSVENSDYEYVNYLLQFFQCLL